VIQAKICVTPRVWRSPRRDLNFHATPQRKRDPLNVNLLIWVRQYPPTALALGGTYQRKFPLRRSSNSHHALSNLCTNCGKFAAHVHVEAAVNSCQGYINPCRKKILVENKDFPFLAYRLLMKSSQCKNSNFPATSSGWRRTDFSRRRRTIIATHPDRSLESRSTSMTAKQEERPGNRPGRPGYRYV
jgi:hypothetical protein